MSPFTLATLSYRNEPRAAIGVEGSYYLIHELQPEQHSTVRSLLNNWSTSFPILEELVGCIISGKVSTVAPIKQSEVKFKTPVKKPRSKKASIP